MTQTDSKYKIQLNVKQITVKRGNSNYFFWSDSQTTSNSPEETYRSCDIESALKTHCEFFQRRLKLQKTEKSE